MMGSSLNGAMIPAHVTSALDRPFVVLFEQQRPDQTRDGVFIGEDADNIGASLDFAVEALGQSRSQKRSLLSQGAEGHLLDGAAGPRMRLTEYEITRRTVGSRSRNRPPPTQIHPISGNQAASQLRLFQMRPQLEPSVQMKAIARWRSDSLAIRLDPITQRVACIRVSGALQRLQIRKDALLSYDSGLPAAGRLV
jgi:hypothetical protein